MMKYFDKYESEELRSISLKENIKNYRKTIIFIVIFLSLAIIIGFLVKYPEKIRGRAFIISNTQVINVYSPNNGEIQLLIKENSDVKKGDILASIYNPAGYSDLIFLKRKLDKFDLDNIENSSIEFKYEPNLKLGDIEKYYYNFLLALIEYKNVLKINISKQKIVNLQRRIKRNEEKLSTGEKLENIINEKTAIIENNYKEDSILFKVNAIVKNRIDEAKITILNAKEKEVDIKNRNQEITHVNEELYDNILLLKKEKEKEIISALFNVNKTFFELKTAIDFWEHNYLLKSPISGKIEFYQPFLNSNQYVKKDMPLFIILPKVDSFYVRGIMSAHGYGKINEEDSVHIKLNDYPYKEYGELKGVISNKSKVYHDSIYYVDIRLPTGLLTNYHKSIDFSYNMSGEVEYYTKKRSIIQRVFSEIHNSVYD